jgi:hypothetical protein
MKKARIAFVSSAYNEAGNLRELYMRCNAAFSSLKQEFYQAVELEPLYIISDNCSIDNSREILADLCKEDPNVIALANKINYGPEPSAVNALSNAIHCELVVLLCSDLQDPPEIALLMARELLKTPDIDAVLGVKTRGAGGILTRFARRSYYKALDYSSRLQTVPGGFHGFGCYRGFVIEETLRYWKMTNLNLRQCLVNACQRSHEISYAQSPRKHGTSSYKRAGYWLEAARSIISGDAAASRLAIFISCAGFGISLVIGIIVAANYLSGHSRYVAGTPTLMALVLLSLAIQLLIFAVLSRQVESLRAGGIRATVQYRKISASAR